MTITKSEILNGLRSLELKSGSNIIVHSALASFGSVDGGADTVIDALLELVGPAGTLLMPAFGISQPLDIDKTPTGLGVIPETFRKRLGVVRSRNPLSSVIAFGPRANDYVQGHENAECPFTEGSPYLKLANDGGYILLLGVDQDRNTTLHTVEALADVPYAKTRKGQWIDEKGCVCEKEYHRFAGPHRNFIGVDGMLREAGICTVGKIGNCVVRLMKSRDLIDFLVPKVRENPNLFISESHDYWDGVWQRGKNRQAKLQETGFRLAVQSSGAGANTAEVLWQAEELGTHCLELDIVNGRDISTFDEDELDSLHRILEKRDFTVETIRCRLAGPQTFEKYLTAGKILGSKGMVVPLVGTIDTLKAKAQKAQNAGIALYVENICISSEEAGDMLTALGACANFAFNPAEFAIAGELPFLKSYKNRTIKKNMRYLTLSDVTRCNAPQRPGLGKAELAEILSILRCGSFDGLLILTHSPQTGTLQDTGDAFWALLERAGVLE